MRQNLAASEQDFRELPDDHMFAKHSLEESQYFGRKSYLGARFCRNFSHKIMPNRISFKDKQYFFKDKQYFPKTPVYMLF